MDRRALPTILLLAVAPAACSSNASTTSADTFSDQQAAPEVGTTDIFATPEDGPSRWQDIAEDALLPDEDAHLDSSEDLPPPLDLIIPDLPPDQKPLLQINEVVTRDANGGPDWFELLATGDEAVDLAEYSVVDGDPSHPLQPLPNITLQPGERIYIEAIASDEWSANHSVPFKLGSNDALLLVHGQDLVDQVSWWGQAPPEGTSLGRLPDGEGNWQLLQPTPDAVNTKLKLKLAECHDPFLWDRATPLTLNLEASAWESMLAQPEAEAWGAADFQFSTIKIPNIGLRIKGGKSITKIAASGSHRFSFKLDFNRYVDIQQFCGTKKVALHNAWGDPSLLREHLAYRLGRELGVPAPRSAFVDLTIGGEHLGTYLMVELVDDGFFLDEHFKNDNGDLYEANAPAGTLQDLGDTFADYPGFDVEKNAGTTNHAALLNFLQVLHDGAAGDWASIMDVNDTLRYLAWNTALANLESYNGTGESYYLYEQEGIFTPIPWDASKAFGSHGCGCTQEQLLALAANEPTCGPLAERPLLDRLLAVPEFHQKYRGYLAEMLEGGLQPATFATWLESAAAIVRPGMANGSYFYSTDEFEAALTEGLPGGSPDGDDIFGLQQFVAERTLHLAAQLAGDEPSTHDGLGNCATE